jgi:SPP1 family predicted phage head-tail adaptor
LSIDETDEQLFAAYVAGRASAFDRLYARHRGGVYRYLLRHVRNRALADELHQDVWMRVIKSRDGFGAEQETWGTVCQVYAGFDALSGQELFAAQKINPNVTHRITIRFRTGILATMRVNWTDTREGRNRIFDIIDSIDPDQRREKLELLAIERNITGDGAAPGPLVGFPTGWGRKNFNEAPGSGRTVFTLPGIPLPSVFQAYVGGQQQGPSHYTLVGNQVTFDFAPSADDEMWSFY